MIPVSTKFDICDWNPRSADTTDAGDRSLSDPVDNFDVFADLSSAVFVEDDAVTLLALAADRTTADRVVATSRLTGIAVPQNFSFEFDLRLSEEIPRSFTDPGVRFFVGAVNQQGHTAGLLFSYQGIAIASYPEDPSPSLLGGSRAFLFKEDGTPKDSVTFRLLLNGEDGRLAIYISDTEVAYSTSTGDLFADLADIDLRYNIPAPVSTLAFGDGLLFHASAKTAALVGELAANTIAALGSVRLSSVLQFPEEKPIASIAAPAQSLVSDVVNLSAAASFDKKGQQLTYVWDLDLVPAGARAKLSGSAQAAVVVGAEVDDNEARFRFKEFSSEGDLWTTVVSVGPPSSGLVLSVNRAVKELRIQLGADAGGTANTFTRDVVDAFFIKGAIGYDAEADDLFAAELVNIDDLNEGVLPVGSFVLAGGGASLLRDPVLLTDAEGVHVIRLRVHNGVRFSSADLHSMLVQSSDQLVGHRPNSDYIFNYLSDFWKLVGDREIYAEVWSAMTQALSGELLSLWQHDFAKSIRDLSRRFQRRWLNHSLFTEVPIEVTTVVVTPALPGRYTIDVVDPLAPAGDRASRAILVSSSTVSPVGVGEVLVRADRFPPSVVDISSIEEGADWTLISTQVGFPSVHVVAERNAGSWVRDPLLVPIDPTVTSHFFDVTYDDPFDTATDRIRLYPGPLRENGVLIPVSSVNEEGRFVTAESREVDGLNYLWDHVALTNFVFLDQIPYITLSIDFDVAASDLQMGDYLQATVVDPLSLTEATVYLTIIATRGQSIFVEWQPLFSALTAVQEMVGNVQQEVGFKTLATLSIKVVGLFKSRRGPVFEDLVGAPGLGLTTIDTSFSQGRDFQIADERVWFTPLLEGQISGTAGSAELTFAQDVERHPDALDASLATLQELGGFLLLIEEGEAGAFLIANISGDKVTLEQPLTSTFTAPAKVLRFGASSPSPVHMWAELSYFDNAQTIENNFGLLVGLPKQDLDVITTGSVDYLEAVRSMAFAFVMGPTFDNMQLAVQALFGLPSTEVPGLIVSIVEPVDSTERGRITILGKDGSVRTYTYPFGAVLATNPRTGEVYQGIDPDRVLGLNPASFSNSMELWREQKRAENVSEEFLTDEEFQALWDLWQNAIVVAYEKLVDVVNIDDYITAPDLMADLLPGQEILRKYHTFVVDVPVDITGTTEIFSVVRRFLLEAKPTYTNLILFGSLRFRDEIDVTDNVVLKPTLLIRDTIHTTPIHTIAGHDETLRWPVDETIERQLILTGAPLLGLGFDVAGGVLTAAAPDLATLAVENGDTVGLLRANGDYHYAVISNIVGTTGDILPIWPDAPIVGTRGLKVLRRYDGAAGVWLDPDDVVEKYESGYTCNFFDDFSGDGSWNSRQLSHHAINMLDSDVDVVKSWIWVSIEKVTGGAQNLLEFLIGEEVELLSGGVLLPSTWDESPPVLEFIGVGENPKIPFGVYIPMNVHPITYVVLDFENQDYVGASNFGHISRLIEIWTNRAAPTLQLRGKTSGAIANITLAPDPDDAVEKIFYHVEHFTRADRYTDFNPEIRLNMVEFVYIPLGGMTLADLEAKSSLFAGVGSGHNVHRQMQKSPYDPAQSEDEQYVPSFDPGWFTDYDLSGEVRDLAIAPAGAAKNNYLVRWGYTDEGGQVGFNSPVTDFTPDSTTTPLENLHIGIAVRERKLIHFTHGFARMCIPGPDIHIVEVDPGPPEVRIEGYFFVADDPTRVAVPDYADPDTFDGDIGGCWVYFRNRDTLAVTPVISYVFEVGNNPAETVLGINGINQPSDGHVLIAPVPGGLALGVYDIIVRNFRPHFLESGGARLVHFDEDVQESAYQEALAGLAPEDSPLGEGGLGIGPVGGTDDEDLIP